VVKAIAEAINPDEARKASTGKTKPEIWKFAVANLGRTGWLPKELRTVHYAGPGSEGYKRPPAAAIGAPMPTPAQSVVKRHASSKPPGKAAPVKRAAVGGDENRQAAEVKAQPVKPIREKEEPLMFIGHVNGRRRGGLSAADARP
jgi:ParB family chromosome partitioning protein